MSSPPADGPTWQTAIDAEGAFRRRPTTFRDAVSDDGSTAHPAEADRYHLYVSLACPWAHRTLITRKLKGLEHVISVDVVDSFLDHDGWSMRGDEPGATGDSVNGKERLREIYQLAEPSYAGRITVPVLWDKRAHTIVNNESSEIIRQFNQAFQHLATRPEVDLYPEPLRERIDGVNEWVYPMINNGVYKCGFARSQRAYDTAARALFEGLDRAEALLSVSRYLVGDVLTEADIRLFTTLVRFDVVYHTHFKCNLKRIADYPNLWGFTRDLYARPEVRETVDFRHIKQHYYRSHDSINPFRIVPIGPEPDFSAPHHRGR